MTSPISRRTFFAALGGGAVAAAVVWGWRSDTRTPAPIRTRDFSGAYSDYADYDGWIMTVPEKQTLIGNRPIKWLENTDLPGPVIASRIAKDATECSSWCLSDESCSSFSFAKPSHPEAEQRGVCRIKVSDSPTAVPSEFHTSGILE